MNRQGNRVAPGLSISNEEFDVAPVHGVGDGATDDGAGSLDQVNVVLYQLSFVPVLFLGGEREGCVCEREREREERRGDKKKF